MRLKVSVVGDLREQMREEVGAGQRAVSRAIAAASDGLQKNWRTQIGGAGLGARLQRTVRRRVFPSQPSMNAAAVVWTKAPTIIGAFERGALIRSETGFFLAIPLPAAGKGFRGRITPGEWERRTGLRLRLVYRRTGPSLLVAEARLSSRGLAAASRSKTGRGVATVPIFVLLSQVRLRKRLDLLAAGERALAGIPQAIVDGWEDR